MILKHVHSSIQTGSKIYGISIRGTCLGWGLNYTVLHLEKRRFFFPFYLFTNSHNLNNSLSACVFPKLQSKSLDSDFPLKNLNSTEKQEAVMALKGKSVSRTTKMNAIKGGGGGEGRGDPHDLTTLICRP